MNSIQPTRDLLSMVMFKTQSWIQIELKRRDIRLTASHMKILHVLEATGISTQRQLRDVMLKDKGQIARLVSGLEKAGMLTRKRDRHDRRSAHLYLTPKSEAVLKSFLEVEREAMNRLLADFSEEEINQFNTLLFRAENSWEKHAPQENEAAPEPVEQ